MSLRLTRVIAAAGFVLAAASAMAGPIEDRIAAGEPLRIGFANIPIWAYPDDDGNADGFVNDIAVETLKAMGHTNIEPVVTDWGGLIPGLKAGRYDMITGGMYITNTRCENIAFSEPVGSFNDAFLVPTDNPKDINNYDDVLNSDAILVTGAGYNTVEAAKKVGITDASLMQVPGPTEIMAAVKAGRADAGVLTYFEALALTRESQGELELGDLAKMPEWTTNWAAIGFRDEDTDFMAKFNEAMGAYIGTEEMLNMVAEHEYTEDHLPNDVTAAWVCENR
ncbi:MAG: transporter substrate-binding domain-containing protein [Geminicoccales bacterium]